MKENKYIHLTIPLFPFDSDMEILRVRNILSNMDASTRASMKKLLPKISMPETPAIKYPSAILSVLPKDESYSLLGFIAEEMLRYPVPEISVENLHVAMTKWCPTLTPKDKVKVQKSKTTEPFLEHIRKTRQEMDKVIKGTLVFDTTVSFGQVEGHPDAQTETQIFEVKMTGQLKKNWVQFLFQVFAYAALDEKAQEIFLVLPMQDIVWSFDLAKWPAKQRTQYRDLMNKTSVDRQVVAEKTEGVPAQTIDRAQIQLAYNIGNHVQKQKNLSDTITALAPYTNPFQMFLGGTISTKLNISDADLAKSAAELAKTTLNLYVHAPYIINLSADRAEKDNFGTKLLIKNLQYANTVGFKGVVVHVGKSVKKEKAEAIENMRTNLLEAMEHASPLCPILLETPAGQGTELLTTYEEFTGFVNGFDDQRIRTCIDTCHIFACGHKPLEYLTRVTSEFPTLVKLIHYNDSSADCGACLDRHAAFGTGKIGLKTMLEIAEHCKEHKYPMVIE